ncbi:type 1 glutamine amidotransferase [Acinetobacter sp. ANC 4779]|uniref:type 1 glutamine amidotransferase domain-containing protein n=1 Tax=Acinetobacter sp. ANC 4779 TaxID=2529848 RepID=UPI0010394FFE|nr:type 1 glutamine amidotransferase domain-containing protein [Acinetobacter sp. ANC 4779]TCB51450.1 type 1 glutamine amidotransferase [Acinetobacter sp. ANC 4779]
MSKRIAVLVTHDFEDMEYSEPVQAFRAARHSVLNVENRAGNIVYGHKRKSAVTIDQSIDDVSVHDFDALLIPGGHSPDRLCGDARFVNFIRNFAHAKKPIMSICHNPQLLISAKVVKGRLMTTLKMFATDLINAGAVYYDVGVVNDNNLYISSRSHEDLPAFIEESLMVLSQ